MYIDYSRVTTITLSEISERLATDDKWLETAIVRLHARQTELEKLTRTTYDLNEVGLQQADAKLFSTFADKIARRIAAGMKLGECLSEFDKAQARRPWNRPHTPIPTICKYRRQVLDMIEKSAKAQLERAR